MNSRQKKLTSFLFCVGLAMFLVLFLSNEVLAALDIGGGTSDVTIPNPLCGGSPNCKITDILDNILKKFLIPLGGVVVAIMVVIGGFQILTAGGNPEKVKTGRHTILYSVIGYAVILFSLGIVSIIKALLQ